MKNFVLLAGTALLFSLLSSSCSRSAEVPMGRVAGTVTLDGKTLETGRVFFSSSELGVAATATLNKDGNYQVEIPLRVGEYQTAVAGPAGVDPKWVPGEPLPPPPPTQIPRKYWDVNTSGLTFQVKKGNNKIDIPIQR